MRKDPAAVDLLLDDIRVMLLRSSYTYDPANQFVTDLGAADNGRSAALTRKSVDEATAVFDAGDTTLYALAAEESNALVVFKHTGNDAADELIAYIDDAVDLPFTPEAGQPCPIAWDNSPTKKIFAL